jgi:hypothetical protein
VFSVESLLTSAAPSPPAATPFASRPEAAALGDEAREAAAKAACNAQPLPNTTFPATTRPTKVPLHQASKRVGTSRKPALPAAAAAVAASSSAAAVEPTRGASHSISRTDEDLREGPSSSSSSTHVQPSGPSGPLLKEYQEAILKARRSADSARREADELRASLSATEVSETFEVALVFLMCFDGDLLIFPCLKSLVLSLLIGNV